MTVAEFPRGSLSNETVAIRWPVIVVGAGIAGATAAAVLAGRGVKVLLLDKDHFPRAKTCGGCLNPRAVRSLERLGLRPLLDAAAPVPLEGIVLRRGRSEARVGFPATDGAPMFSVSRRVLDAALAQEAARRGAVVRTGVRVAGSLRNGDVRVLRVRDETGGLMELAAELVLACDGLGSVLARDAGLSEDAPPAPRPKIGISALLPWDSLNLPERQITMTTHRNGYVGVVAVRPQPTEDRCQWNVAAAVLPEAVRAGGGAWEAVARILLESGLVAPDADLHPTQPTTCPTLLRRVRQPWAERILLVGDAAGYIEPFTGEGMTWALAAAEAAIDIAVEGWSAATGPRYEAAWRAAVQARSRWAGAAARILDSVAATRAAVAMLRLFPPLGNAFVRNLVR